MHMVEKFGIEENLADFQKFVRYRLSVISRKCAALNSSFGAIP